MGYTHYWDGTITLSQGVVDAVLAIIAQAEDNGIPVRGPNGTGDPIVTIDSIEFNGSEEHDQDYETFVVRQGDTSFTCTKTAEYPYDAVVGAVLFVLAEASGDDLGVSSDGSWKDWMPARNLYTQVVGEEPKNILIKDN